MLELYIIQILNIFWMMLSSSLVAILIIDFLTPFQFLKNKMGLDTPRRLVSDIPFIDLLIYIVWKIMSCPSCFSAHIFWICYAIINCSLFGMVLCPIVFFLTFIIKDKILSIHL